MTESADDRAIEVMARAIWLERTGNADWKPTQDCYREARAALAAYQAHVQATLDSVEVRVDRDEDLPTADDVRGILRDDWKPRRS